MKILKRNYLAEKQERALSELVECCNEADGTAYGIPGDADICALAYDRRRRLVSAAAVYRMGDTYTDGKHEGIGINEIAAFTLPGFRRRKYFTRLIAELSDELRDTALRFAVYENADCMETLSRIHASYSHDELMMAADIADIAGFGESAGETEAAGETEKTVIDSIEQKAFSDFSECYYRLTEDGKAAYIFGVMTYENYRRQGHAAGLLRSLFKELKASGIRTVTLQVSSANVPAVSLYTGLGMSICDRLSYYYVV